MILKRCLNCHSNGEEGRVLLGLLISNFNEKPCLASKFLILKRQQSSFYNYSPQPQKRNRYRISYSTLHPFRKYFWSKNFNFNFQYANFISSSTPQTKKEYSERRIMGYSMEQMFDVVSDVEMYEKFLPWCESSKVKLKRPGFIIADLVLGMKPLAESYTSNVTMVRPTFIKAVSSEGQLFQKLVNTWRFSPGLKSHPSSCMIDFFVTFEFRSALHSTIGNVFFNEVVTTMAGAFYNEAKARYGEPSCVTRKIVIDKHANKKS